ncbi:Phosphate regulon transcriptional regulatory protein PhoB [Mycobacterium attenuatum]|uniref:winged helix-turn-helix domain-containing protein n=1 Tax=Mycobacterium attenuatum TaxID=2341086 RepID=UPI000F166AE1|nr:response regulator transcription factor [Mycobacterium attenuatum]VBA50200.1 Phosphate regulon transcriptional regulatory protein PhoB [Mycobacterium attenuatum]
MQPTDAQSWNPCEGVGRRPLEVLLISNDADFESALPTLPSVARSLRRAPLDDRLAWQVDGADVAMIDARNDLGAARRACRRLTASAPALAVLAVVAPADFIEVDVDWNFDDVLLEAAGAAELQARLRMAVTRRRNALEGTLEFGGLVLHPDSYAASLGGKDLGLTATEFKLLAFFVQHAGRAFTRTRLMHEVWGYDCAGQVRTVDVHVRRRAKLGAEYAALLETVRSVGYRVATPPEPRWIVRQQEKAPVAAAAADSCAQ